VLAGGLLNEVRKDYGGVEREYREALRCAMNHTNAHSNLGIQLKNVRKDSDGAEHEYREAIRSDQNHANALVNLPKAVRKDYDGAENEFRETIRCDVRPEPSARTRQPRKPAEGLAKHYDGAESQPQHGPCGVTCQARAKI
jgi:Flp pilus assembly protein TadD